jgi:hypothetical protein
VLDAALRHLARCREAALDVGEDIVDVLDADGQAHVAIRHAGCGVRHGPAPCRWHSSA